MQTNKNTYQPLLQSISISFQKQFVESLCFVRRKLYQVPAINWWYQLIPDWTLLQNQIQLQHRFQLRYRFQLQYRFQMRLKGHQHLLYLNQHLRQGEFFGKLNQTRLKQTPELSRPRYQCRYQHIARFQQKLAAVILNFSSRKRSFIINNLSNFWEIRYSKIDHLTENWAQKSKKARCQIFHKMRFKSDDFPTISKVACEIEKLPIFIALYAIELGLWYLQMGNESFDAADIQSTCRIYYHIWTWSIWYLWGCKCFQVRYLFGNEKFPQKFWVKMMDIFQWVLVWPYEFTNRTRGSFPKSEWIFNAFDTNTTPFTKWSRLWLLCSKSPKE